MTGALPLADHGGVVTMLPFVVPAMLLMLTLGVIVVRDRLRRRRRSR